MENDLTKLISKLRDSPKNQELINSIGIHYLNNKNFEAAIKYFKQNLSLNHSYYKFHFNIGLAYDELKQYDLAIIHYKEVIKLNKNFELVYFKLGNIYLNSNKLDLSINYFSQSIEINAKNIFSIINRGLAYHKSQKFDNALKDFTLAISMEKNNWLALVNRGNTYKKLYEFSKAESDYKQVLTILPNNAEACFNLAGLFQEIEKFDVSIDCYNESINLNYEVDSSKYNKSLIQLLKGDLINGFKNHEYRWKTKSFLKVNQHIEIPRPKNLKEIKNKKILVFCEQGIGDIIQFSRYLIELEKICKEIIFEVPSYLVEIMNNLKLEKTVIIKKYKDISQINFCISLLSLPNFYKTNLKTIPLNIPYFKNNLMRENEWKKKFDSKKLNIGIC